MTATPPTADARDWALLAGGGLLAADDLRAARDWWAAAGRPGEGAVAFLLRVGVLGDRADKEFALVRKGYLRPATLAHLLAPGGTDRVRAAALPTPRAEPETTSADGPPTLPLAAPAAPGLFLGRCRLVARVGGGGAGVVYRAVHQTLDIPVAVKVLRPDRAAAAGQLRQEARLLARLTHPHVVRLWDFDDAGDCPHLVLEWVDGLSLAEVLRRDGRLPPARAALIAAQTASALAAADRLGIVHRDVKPGNILLDRAGTVKLTDLGTAAAGDGPDGRPEGTPAFMAPEVFRGHRPDHRADQYSLGVALYQALTGRLPFAGNTPLELMVRHAEEPPVPPARLAPGVPAAASASVLRMLSKDPAARFPGYRAVAAALAPVWGGSADALPWGDGS